VKPSIESRALLEDTAGSGQAISPQAWSADFVDVLLPNTILGEVGANRVAMEHETLNVPVYTSTVSPNWLAEAASISVDANPAFAPLSLFAPGGVKVITTVSLELMQDAYVRGGLDSMLSNAIARKMGPVVDTAMLLGITGNTGVPGLINETGFVTRKQTGDAGTTGKSPTDTSELGVIAESVMKKNVMPTHFVSNVGVREAYERIPIASYGRYWVDPSIVKNMDWVTSENAALPYTETDPATASTVAQTGGSYGSLYAGNWQRFCYLGVRLDLQTRVLTERYIDSGLVGIFAWMRFSLRFGHPETFVRTIGVIPA
jgi:hypothetical protein